MNILTKQSSRQSMMGKMKRTQWMKEGLNSNREGSILMPPHEEINPLLSVSCFHWMDGPENPSSVAGTIISTGRHVAESSNKHTMTESLGKRKMFSE